MKNNAQKTTGGKPVYSTETITPDQADAILANHNNRNRAMSLAHAQRLAAEMSAGNWVLSNDAIVFDGRGNLVNGQHRICAVALSKVPCEFFVVRGLTDKARDIMDCPMRRTIGDLLSINHGLAHGKFVAAIAATLKQAENNDRTSAMTVGAALDAYKRHKPAFDWVLGRMGMHRSFFTSAGLLAALMLGREAVPKETEFFHDALLNPVNVSINQNAVLKLRDWGMARGRGKSGRMELFYRACNALMHYASCEVTRTLSKGRQGYEALVEARKEEK